MIPDVALFVIQESAGGSHGFGKAVATASASGLIPTATALGPAILDPTPVSVAKVEQVDEV